MIKKGFTLAEVLLTLIVIGVLAVMVLPTLLQSIEEQDRLSAYKKSLAVLSEAVQLMKIREIQCDTIKDNNDLAECMSKVFLAGTLDDNTILLNDGQSYAFFWRKGSPGEYTECGEVHEQTEGSWTGADANCVVVIDVDGPYKHSMGFDDYSQLKAISAPRGVDQFPMVLTLHSPRPAFYVGSKGFEYSFGKEATSGTEPWNRQ